MKSLALDTKHFTFDSFLECLSKNPQDIFTKSNERKWLKIDLISSIDDWQSLFQNYNLEKRGEMYYFQMDNDNSMVEYYVYEIKKGLLIFLNMSGRDAYKSTLKSFIRHTRGITNMFFSFDSFESIINFIRSHYNSTIYSFTARRNGFSKHHAKIRNNISRSIRYTGSDADYSLGELKENYGVAPTIIDFKIESNKIRITNDGFILIRDFNLVNLRIVAEIIDHAIAEPLRLLNISKQILYTSEEKWNNFEISKLMSGKITFNTTLDTTIINQFFQNYDISDQTDENTDLPKFSFIDTNLSEEPFTYSATAVDEDKGIIFGISGNSQQLILVPRHETTFESFINFYRLVNEIVDKSSNFNLFNEPHNKKYKKHNKQR